MHFSKIIIEILEFCKDVVPFIKCEVEEVQRELQKAFKATDKNGDGFISEEEIWDAINSGRFTGWSKDKVQDAVNKAEKDENGRFNYHRKKFEFSRGI